MPGEFDLRKGIHVKLLPDTHAEFRILTIRRGVSMQEVIEEFAARAVAGDRACTKLMDDIVERKKLKIARKMSPTDAESIFDAIELDDQVREMNEKDSSEFEDYAED